MKSKLIAITACALLGMATAGAQNAYDAERLTSTELNGTARFVGMGGAMGALGGDISVMGTNPAGIGIYRSNDVAATFGFNATSTKSAFNGTSMSEDRTRASFDQIGFVWSNKIGNNTTLRYVNFGFNYHKSKNFNRLFSAGGALNDFSQSWQLAQEMANVGLTGAEYDDILSVKNPYDKYWNELPVLGIMGVMTGVVDWPVDIEKGPLGWNGHSNNFYSDEKGGIHEYDFNVAFNIEDRFYIGASLGVKDAKYSRYTSYTEELNDDNGAENGGYTLENFYDLTGTGVDFKLGVIVRPFEESPFRLGLAVHTPTWYELSESYNSTLSSDIFAFDSPYKQTLSDYLSPDYLNYDYRLITPWKFNVSAGTTLGGLVAVGAEYEYADYSSAKLQDIDGYDLGGQAAVEEQLKGVHTFRVGLEARLAPAFSLRAGYNYSTAAFNKDSYNALATYSTQTDFNNTEARNTFTFGVGYRGSVVYADLAYKYDAYKSNFYAFDDIELPATKVDNNRSQLLFTLGARF